MRSHTSCTVLHVEGMCIGDCAAPTDHLICDEMYSCPLCPYYMHMPLHFSLLEPRRLVNIYPAIGPQEACERLKFVSFSL